MLEKLTLRTVALIVGGLIIAGLILFTLSQCQKRRSEASQARVERSQAQAASNSAADAVNTVAASGEAQAASEELGRKNAQDIQGAEGAKVPAGAGVNAAGRAALCKRKAYQNEPMCKGARP
jgi:FtsZ-interacting cell division protein ZipA